MRNETWKNELSCPIDKKVECVLVVSLGVALCLLLSPVRVSADMRDAAGNAPQTVSNAIEFSDDTTDLKNVQGAHVLPPDMPDTEQYRIKACQNAYDYLYREFLKTQTVLDAYDNRILVHKGHILWVYNVTDPGWQKAIGSYVKQHLRGEEIEIILPDFDEFARYFDPYEKASYDLFSPKPADIALHGKIPVNIFVGGVPLIQRVVEQSSNIFLLANILSQIKQNTDFLNPDDYPRNYLSDYRMLTAQYEYSVSERIDDWNTIETIITALCQKIVEESAEQKKPIHSIMIAYMVGERYTGKISFTLSPPTAEMSPLFEKSRDMLRDALSAHGLGVKAIMMYGTFAPEDYP